MTRLNLELITNPRDFDQFCRELMKAVYPDSVSFDDSMGDDGIDCSRENGTILYQFYRPEPSSIPEKSKKIKRKILNTVKKVAERKPEELHFMIPCKTQEAVHNYLKKQQDRYCIPRMTIIDSTEIMVMLSQHLHIEQAWVRKTTDVDYGITPAAVTYDKRDSPSGLLEIGSNIAKSIQPWKYGHLYSQKLELDSQTGTATWSMSANTPEIAKSHPLTIEGSLSVKRDDVITDRIREFLRTGKAKEPVVIEKQQIASMQVRIGSLPLELFGEVERMVLIPIVVPRPIRIRLFDSKHLLIAELTDYEFVGDGNEEGATLTCQKQNDGVLIFRIELSEKQGTCNMKINKCEGLKNASEAFEFLSIVGQFNRAKVIEVWIDESKKLLELGKSIIRPSKYYSRMYQLTKKTKEISEILGISMPSILDRELTENDASGIEEVHQILITGKRRWLYSDFTATLSEINRDLVGKMKSGATYRIKQTGVLEYDLLGQQVSLGEVVRYFEVWIDDGAVELFRKLLYNEEASVQLKLKPPPEINECVEFYLNWHRKPKEREKYER